MPQTIERHGYTVDDAGIIHHDDRPISWARIDQLAGRRMDRRKSYAVIDGEVHSIVKFTSRCSGCSDDFCGDRGAGCEECGHHGVVRQAHWVPETVSEEV